QEWQGAVTFASPSGVYLSSVANPQTLGPTASPPDASALPIVFCFFNNPGTNAVHWSQGWTGTGATTQYYAYNEAQIGTMDTAPDAAVTASISFDAANSSWMYWTSM